MEKNYYEILEIDKNASQEIIEKAYKEPKLEIEIRDGNR